MLSTSATWEDRRCFADVSCDLHRMTLMLLNGRTASGSTCSFVQRCNNTLCFSQRSSAGSSGRGTSDRCSPGSRYNGECVGAATEPLLFRKQLVLQASLWSMSLSDWSDKITADHSEEHRGSAEPRANAAQVWKSQINDAASAPLSLHNKLSFMVSTTLDVKMSEISALRESAVFPVLMKPVLSYVLLETGSIVCGRITFNTCGFIFSV